MLLGMVLRRNSWKAYFYQVRWLAYVVLCTVDASYGVADTALMRGSVAC
jgi:hypothetical protein